MSLCRHDLEAAWCATCKGQRPQPRIREGRTIAARFDAKCPGCGDQVIIGEDIHLTVQDGSSQWVCTACNVRAITL